VIRTLVAEAVTAGARRWKACEMLGIAVRTLERWGDDREDGRHGPKSEPANKLSATERRRIIAVATSAEFRDESPKQMVPTLADRGEYIGSESTIYRVLHAEDMQHRRGVARAPTHRPREHVADGPWQVASWDITYLKSHVRGAFFYLYLVEDVWSRKILGWEVHDVECNELAAALVERIRRENPGVDLHGWVLHSDNGGPMKGATMLATMQRLGVVPSFSRPSVSNDNPFSESLFRTTCANAACARINSSVRAALVVSSSVHQHTGHVSHDGLAPASVRYPQHGQALRIAAVLTQAADRGRRGQLGSGSCRATATRAGHASREGTPGRAARTASATP
jgi:transposase InsO family protein